MKYLLTLTILLTGFLCSSQNFEGIITYRVEIENPNPKIIPDSIYYSRIEKSFIEKHYYKDNKYKSVCEVNGEKEIELFVPSLKRLYSYDQDEDIASWTDTTKRLDKIVEVKNTEKTFEILGLECNALAFNLKKGYMFFAFSKKISMDSKLFKGHRYNFWEDFLKETNAIPLSMKISTPFDNRTLTAIEIQEKKLSSDEFRLPKFEQTIESMN